MERLTKKAEHDMTVRVFTGIGLVLTLGPAFVLGGWYLIAASLLLVGAATHELLSAPGKKRYTPFIWGWTYLGMYSLVYWSFLKEDGIRTHLFQGNFFSVDQMYVSVFAIVIYLVGLFCFSYFNASFRLEDIFYLFTMVFIVSLGFYSILYLRFLPTAFLNASNPADVSFRSNWNVASSLLLLFVVLGVCASDVGAYFFGVFFGKHLMNPRVSPHKTWEGFAGGTITSIAATLSIASLAEFGFGYPLISSMEAAPRDGLSFVSQGGLGAFYIVLLSLLIPVMDNIGGFIFSAVKRHFSVKDWGFVLPGHGGIIDRFDSTFVTGAIAAILVSFITNGWRFLNT